MTYDHLRLILNQKCWPTTGCQLKITLIFLFSCCCCFVLYFCSTVKVACFIYADQLTELRDFTGEVNRDNTNKVVKACAALAKAKDYKLFALGKNGVCLSGPDMKKKYHVEGSLSAECNHGIGIGNNNMFVYSLGKMAILFSHFIV